MKDIKSRVKLGQANARAVVRQNATHVKKVFQDEGITQKNEIYTIFHSEWHHL